MSSSNGTPTPFADLRGRVAVVTGGASNIGRGITLQLAERGAEVWILDRDEAQAKKTAFTDPDRLHVATADLLDHQSLVDAVDEVMRTSERIDILVNNAGWVNTVDFAQKERAEVELEVRLNLLGPLVLTHLVLPGMIDAGWGRIISIASEAGRAGQRGQVAYSAAKGGLLGMTRSLSHEVGRHGITVNAICPAMTIPDSTDAVGTGSMQQVRDRPPELMRKIVKRYPVGRVGRPRDVAATVAFLSSDEAEFITGQAIPVNGGFVTA